MPETKSFGNLRSHPEQTPGKIWLATTVWKNSELGTQIQLFNLIYPTHNNPEFIFRTKKNSPWLSIKEIIQINYPHTQKGQERISVMRDYLSIPFLEISFKTLWQEKVIKKQYLFPTISFETKEGGWVFENTKNNNSYSEIMNKLIKRQEFKLLKDMKNADLIRSELINKIEIRDLPTGTMFFFPY